MDMVNETTRHNILKNESLDILNSRMLKYRAHIGVKRPSAGGT